VPPAPDYADALIGWRVWCVVQTPEGLRLASVIQDETWPAGGVLVARCHADRDPSNTLLLGAAHEAPGESCACGVHAAREPAAVLSYLRGRNEPGTIGRVLGRVLLWGRVVEHEGGWRASHAYPLDLVGDDPAFLRAFAAYA
jgi:hypothetical protein